MNIYITALTLTVILLTVAMQPEEHDSYDYDPDVDWIPMAQGI